MDYVSKIYTNPIREAGVGVKPHLQGTGQPEEERKRATVSRGMTGGPKVTTSGEGTEVKVRGKS